eukprot:g10789.t1
MLGAGSGVRLSAKLPLITNKQHLSSAKRRARQETWEDRTLVVRISNGSSKAVEVDEPVMMAGRCVLSFSQLLPGQSGFIRFSSAGGEFFGNATSGCHHAGRVGTSGLE